MKHYFFFIVLFAAFFSPVLSSGQINLVPNPSFEDTVFCPTGVTQITGCEHWSSFGNTPDYFNACKATGVNVPNAPFGFQYAHSGEAMTGLITYRRPNSPDGPNYREYIGATLINPTIPGSKYYFSFYINFGGLLPPCVAADKAGIRFSTQSYSTSQLPPLSNWAHVYTDTILSDSINWIRIEGSMIADSSYTSVIIGNFFDDANTDTMHVGALRDYSYYYIDDVCITTDSVYNEYWTGVNDLQHSNQLILYPNPSTDKLFLRNIKTNGKYMIQDNLGRIIQTGEINAADTEFRIHLNRLTAGSYQFSFISDKEVMVKSFIKTDN
jgi:hypothetical protein